MLDVLLYLLGILAQFFWIFKGKFAEKLIHAVLGEVKDEVLVLHYLHQSLRYIYVLREVGREYCHIVLVEDVLHLKDWIATFQS